jgi:hypothetical protein
VCEGEKTVIETKQVDLNKEGDGNYSEDLQAFGWQKTQEVSRRVGKSTHDYAIMVRETTMNHYDDYRKLEKEYESNKANIKYYQEAEISTALLLLLLFIIPGVIYIAVKTSQKNKINENNSNCLMAMRNCVDGAKKI